MMSPVEALLENVWANVNRATGHSWQRTNHGMHAALQLAVASGYKFTVADFDIIYHRFRGGWWMVGGGIEDFYGLAIASGNLSAAMAIEGHLQRRPFMVDRVFDPGSFHRWVGSPARRKRGRLAVGSRFYWDGRQVKVTSFGDTGDHVVACSYKDEESQPEKIYRLTRKQLKEGRES